MTTAHPEANPENGMNIHPNYTTLALWFVVNLALAALLFMIMPSTFLKVFAPLVSLAYFGYYSLRKVDIAHVGVVLVFGKRTKLYVGEGWTGVGPYPLVDIQEVDLRQTPLQVAGGTYISLDGIDITVRGFPIIYQVINAWRVLELGPDHIMEFVSDVVAREARTFISRKHAVGNVEEDTDTSTVIHQGTELAETIDQAVSTTANDKGWGIRVIQVAVPELLLPDSIIQAAAKVVKEKYERMAERTELSHVQDRIRELLEMPGMTLDAAINIVQTERSKVTRRVVDVKGRNPLEIAAGTIISGEDSDHSNGKGGE
jgi:regulator of protease activity HflC (stomatin/prohibitin superfamily)